MLLCVRHWCDAVVWEALVRCCCVGGIGAMLLCGRHWRDAVGCEASSLAGCWC